MSANERHFLLRNPSFALVWVGQVLSQSGGRMYQIAMIWWLLSGAPASGGKLVGLFMLLAALPSLLLVKVIGRTLDGRSAKPVLVIGDALAAAVIASVAGLLYLGLLPIGFVFLAGLVAAALQAFIDPGLNKAVGEVVEKRDFDSAVALLASTQSLANFMGAVMGAMLIDRLGVAGTAFLAALGYMISSTCTALARFRFVTAAQTDGERAEGWSLLDGYPLLKRLLIGFGLVNFFATPTLVVLPLYVKRTLSGTATTLGGLEAALWVGLLVGTAASGFIRFSPSRIRIGAVCLAVLGLALGIPGVVTEVFVYRVGLFIGGAALGVNNVKFMAYFQEVVAPEIKGRFFALMQAVIGFTFPIAYFLFGALTDVISPPQVCLIQGIGVVSLSLYFLSLAREEGRVEALAGSGTWR